MKKIKQEKGFTLIEMLACIITLLLMLGIVTSGTNFAVNSFNRSMYESNSQMLESTINTYLMDILRHAKGKDVETVEGEPDEALEVIRFTSPSYQINDGMIGIKNGTDGSGPYLVYITENNNTIMIVGENVYAETLYISKFELLYNKDKGYFTGSYIIKSTILEDAERECVFTCRTIAEY